MSHHDESLIREISRRAQVFRKEALEMVYGAQSGHLGGAFSAAEIVASLFFHHLKLDPTRPDWPERDRFLFSKGARLCRLLRRTGSPRFLPGQRALQFPKAEQPAPRTSGPTEAARS